MASKVRCGGCPNIIETKDFLKCCICKKSYDLVCANKSIQKFRKMTKDEKKEWDCEECKNKKPKICNLNTPVRSRDDDSPTHPNAGETDMDSMHANVTKRTMTRPAAAPSATLSPDLESVNKPINDPMVTEISERVLEAIGQELPSMFTRILHQELTTIKSDLRGLQDSVQFLSDSHDAFRTSVDCLLKDNAQLKKENQELKTTVSNLSERLNNMEQHLRENNLELHGVPEFQNENLLNLLSQCSKVVGLQQGVNDIVHCTRVAKLNKENKSPRTIIVRFRGVRCRDEFYSAVYRYNKANPNDKLNTSLLGIAGDKKPVYVSEHLSPINKALHAATRQKAKDVGYSFVWVRNGRIYVRKEPGSAYIHIKNNDSLTLIQ